MFKAGRELAAIHDTLGTHKDQLDEQKKQLEALSREVADLKRTRGLTPRDIESPRRHPVGSRRHRQ